MLGDAVAWLNSPIGFPDEEGNDSVDNLVGWDGRQGDEDSLGDFLAAGNLLTLGVEEKLMESESLQRKADDLS